MRTRDTRAQDGFTLVELSIVLIIIGLLIGGILKGQELIRNAQSKSLIAQLDAYRTANNGFLDKYGQYPGDFSRASALLAPKQDGSPQIDGDGNGRVDGQGNDAESLEYWQHLAAADLVAGINGITPVPGVGIPVGRLPGSAWNALSARGDNDGLCPDCTLRGNYWRLGAPDPSALTTMALMPADESYLLDAKIDDGKPTTGLMQAGQGGGGPGEPCQENGEYATADARGSDPSCLLGFMF